MPPTAFRGGDEPHAQPARTRRPDRFSPINSFILATPQQRAFLAAYAPCHDAFLRYCTTVAYGKCDVEDLVQDVMLTAFKHFAGIEPGKLLHYLIRAARNRSISLGRGRRCKPEELREQCMARLQAKGASADAAFETEALYRALHRLPEAQRNAVVLFEINGFSLREIAGLQQCSEASVKMKLSRARKRLRQLLTEPARDLRHLMMTAKTIAL